MSPTALDQPSGAMAQDVDPALATAYDHPVRHGLAAERRWECTLATTTSSSASRRRLIQGAVIEDVDLDPGAGPETARSPRRGRGSIQLASKPIGGQAAGHGESR